MNNKILNLRNKNRDGFTLAEVLLAVLIIGILAIAVFVILDYIRIKSADAKRVTDINKIDKALEVYYDKYAFYPDTLSDLLEDGFLSFVPIPATDAGQSEYSYVPLGANGICTGFHLGASLRDKSHDVLIGDSDSYPGIPCAGAKTKDFDGTAVYCKSGEIGEGSKNDTCFDIAR